MITHGRLDDRSRSTQRVYVLREGMGGAELELRPEAEIAGTFEAEARQWLGSELEVTGISDGRFLSFWAYVPFVGKGRPGREPGLLAVADIVADPGSVEGRVRVLGRFRGRNLFGELPAASARSRDDWVLGDEGAALWVTGRKPKGDGWELDPADKGDAGRWLEVEGKLEARGGVVYLKAERVALAKAPKREP